MRKQTLLLFTILLTSIVASAQPDTVFVKDLYSGWQTFDEQGLSVPYIQRKSDIVFFEMPVTESGAILRVKTNAPFDIWINDQIFRSKFVGTLNLDIDSVRNQFLERPTLTFYANDWRESELSTQVYAITNSAAGVFYGRIAQSGSLDHNSFLIMLSIIVIWAGIYRRFYPSTFSKSFSNPLTLKFRGLGDDQTYQNFLGFDNMFAVLFLGLLGSLLSYYLGFQLINLGLSPSWKISVPALLLTALIGVAMVILKFLWSKVIAYIFQFREIPNIQNQDFIHFLILLTAVSVTLALVDFTIYNFTSQTLKMIIIILYVILLVFFQFWMMLKLDKFYSHRKLMIISYLCSTEILPSFVIIIWLLKS